MKTIRLIGLENNEKNRRSSFIFEQSEIFQKFFNEILKKINIGEIIYDEQLPLKSRVNEIDHFKNEDYDLDIIYTPDTIVLIARANQQNLEKLKSLILAGSKIEE